MIELSPGERTTGVWVKLMRHFEERLTELRSKNDGPLDATATADMRGRIAEIKSLMALDKDKPKIDPLTTKGDFNY